MYIILKLNKAFTYSIMLANITYEYENYNINNINSINMNSIEF